MAADDNKERPTTQKIAETIIVMAHFHTKDQLIDMVDEAIEKYKLNQSKENEFAIETYCRVLLTKVKIEHEGGIVETMLDFKKYMQREELFNVNKGAKTN